MIKLRPIEREDISKIKEWRNIDSLTLRTPFQINSIMQDKWFENVVSNRDSNFKFFALENEDGLIGYGALEISWYNRGAELGLLIGKEYQGKGYGKQAVSILLDQAFNFINLDSVCFETYLCNPGFKFWQKILKEYKPLYVQIPYRVFREGKYWGSDYYVVLKENFK